MNTDTSTRCPGATAARATPSSNAPRPSFDAPYTDIASPAERSTKERRVSPAPAGAGMPGSIAGSPLPARAARAGMSWEREKSLQQSAMASGGLEVGGGGNELPQRVLAHRLVRADLPGFHAGGKAVGRELDEVLVRGVGERRVVEEGDRARDGRGGVLVLVVRRGAVPRVHRAAPHAGQGRGVDGHVEARLPARGVEPHRVVPARHVGRVEELLPRLRAEPGPRLAVDAAA